MSKKISLRRSPIHGNGVFAATDIAPEVTLTEYRGRRLTHDQADDLYGEVVDTGHTFLFTLNDDYVIDANFEGNIARWINHSCAPNCQPVLIEDSDDVRIRDKVVIESLRQIRPGEELTYNYGITLDEPHTARLKRLWACRCGAPNCSGTMLQPKRKARKPRE
jgi:SET domain-containing protein